MFRHTRLLATLAFALALGCNLPQATAQSTAANHIDLTYAAEKSVNSVVYIKVTVNSKTQMVDYYDPFEDFFGDFFGRGNGGRSQRRVETPKRTGAGSGVILSADGYIVTNNHVVEGADELLVKLNDNREFKARIIGLDKTTDLALIKIEAKNLPAISVAKSEDLRLGEWVLAIGNPYGLTSTVTAGIVSAKARSLGGGNGIESFIQTDAAINPGNSGGALVNAHGELVGINAMLYSQTGSFTGYGFAIPTSIMNKVVDDLKQYGTVQRAVLGISGTDVTNYIDAQKEKGNDVDLGSVTGIYVNDVTADGAAAEGGIKSGDVITGIDGKDINKFGEMSEILAMHKPGDRVKVTYIRDKKTREVTLTLRNVQGTTSTVEHVDTDQLGAALRPLTAEEKEELKLPYGLVVTSVKSGKMMDAGITKGIIIMKINDTEMRTVADFEEVVKTTNMSSDRVLWIRAKTQSGINKSFSVELADPEKAPAKDKGKK